MLRIPNANDANRVIGRVCRRSEEELMATQLCRGERE